MAGGDNIVLPLLAWVECTAAVARKTQSSELARRAGEQLRALRGVRWLALDDDVADVAVNVAAECRLRAADSVYVAAARTTRALLVTLDRELGDRCAGQVPCASPADWNQDG
jgi:predicted nucleic acid-binding protein